MRNLLLRFWTDDEGQDIAEYAVMLADLGTGGWTIRLVGSNANNAFFSGGEFNPMMLEGKE